MKTFSNSNENCMIESQFLYILYVVKKKFSIEVNLFLLMEIYIKSTKK